MHIAALPVPLTFGLSGSLAIGTAGNIATCQVQAINPVDIPAIGFVCISPGASCAPGVRYCGPGAPASGPPLGVAIGSDGNGGSCASNAACQANAVALCAGQFGPGFTVLTAQCTGQCSGSTPQACTTDADCQPANGTCNGPDPVGGQAGKCQVTCINQTAHGSSDPGDTQCNLGLDVTVESAGPCDGTDIVIDVGQLCIPLTTQRATATITDANFITASTVPPPPNLNDQSGSPLACTTVDSSVLSGFVAVGAFDAFNSALGDTSIGFKATCQ
jgi:hypothetical protein